MRRWFYRWRPTVHFETVGCWELWRYLAKWPTATVYDSGNYIVWQDGRNTEKGTCLNSADAAAHVERLLKLRKRS